MGNPNIKELLESCLDETIEVWFSTTHFLAPGGQMAIIEGLLTRDDLDGWYRLLRLIPMSAAELEVMAQIGAAQDLEPGMKPMSMQLIRFSAEHVVAVSRKPTEAEQRSFEQIVGKPPAGIVLS